ncbi:MAG: hypothetical protein COV60_03295 [Candidatus Magasanikbacteria bacterium CG11_big_fil_rev_8_21_14_0_20_43_7]|uniref:Uncharacterized protein n=1 Tax=Candidatus Magasanikbacteria bacterium CG11_big_fil_rev_8_21_14_0_20_43_7 TaxID=1974654 RepID=A0A2H0N1W7_9BACT|nr:MAG: hypothetical protein COV60_03295 [Candidatus Magasanikbacteria bacterium CG11_big_fil_rev_8_21_14_0_20_43_7]
MKKQWYSRIFFIVFAYVFVSIFVPSAYVFSSGSLTEKINTQVKTAGNAAGLEKRDVAEYIGSGVQIVLGFIGTLFLVLIVFAGYVRLTSHGEEDRVKKSTSTAISALLGLVIVLLAYGITRFVVTRVYNETTYEPTYQIDNQAPNAPYNDPNTIMSF